jgi:hypothetical protein
VNPLTQTFHTVCKNYAPCIRFNGISHLQCAEIRGKSLFLPAAEL